MKIMLESAMQGKMVIEFYDDPWTTKFDDCNKNVEYKLIPIDSDASKIPNHDKLLYGDFAVQINCGALYYNGSNNYFIEGKVDRSKCKDYEGQKLPYDYREFITNIMKDKFEEPYEIEGPGNDHWIKFTNFRK